ncbi:fimbrial biogenesis outer membrane usher protein [Citrobacter sp. wls830]|uniref:fimbria/pilus outer membrane usher protein n=1 Tax=Citrobacter sp. wls615 TaxID=2576435 RepID=UPI0010C944B7|nr:fimbria/pilus outer membrane usher protein [Citrobacter sp. wls615]TKU01738.1 fimbrial biogenesis outer membrane usher protein [Citrobacter sp. wls830]TKV14232.1 fimbrial biogenesis outer membrane usher protein [Citrobacter sp. wls615]
MIVKDSRRLKRLVILQCASLLLYTSDIYAANEKKNISFSQGFMHFYDNGTDLSQFDGVEKIIPGEYRLEVYNNLKKIDTWPVRFIAAKNAQGVNACMTPEMIIRFDVDTDKLPKNWQTQSCLILPELIPGATVSYNQEDEQLDVTIPQAMLLNTPVGYISPELWDDGVPALMAAYSLSASSTHYREPQQENTNYGYGNLLTSLSLGSWRFTTYDSAHSGNNGQADDFQHIQAYAERGIAPLQSQITLGDLSTTGDFFDTTGIRGIRLATDDRMLPDSVRSYAPIVRGMANSNATVTIKQSGNVIYEQVVPPGEFAISDLYATGYNGDLEVTVKETNGKQTSFTVPYSSVPQLLREGYSRYSLAGGEIRNSDLRDDPTLLEGTFQYGIMNNLTGYIGGQNAFDGDYAALMGGFAVNTPIGALGLDVTRSFTHFDNMPKAENCGQFCNMSLRVSLSRNLAETGTNFSLIGYRYSSQNYYSLADAVSLKKAIETGQQDDYPERFRERVEANINQVLPDGWGSFYISGFVGNVWNSERSQNDRSNFTLGYNNQIGSTSWGISYGRTNNDEGGHEDTLYLNVSIPFGRSYEKKARLTANFSYNSDEANFRTALNGSAGEYSQFGFGGYFSQSNRPETNFGMNLSWTGESATTGMTYSQSRDSFMGGINMSGGLVVHQGGINFTPSLSDTIGIIEAKGAEGSHVYPDSRAVIKKNGYGIVSYLSPYKYNDVYLDPKGTAMSVDIEDAHRKIVPRAGAAVLIKMQTQRNKQTLVYFKSSTTESIPFGASINDKDMKNIGMVGQGGLAMVVLDEGDNTFTIKWKKNKQNKQCTVNYQFTAADQPEESKGEINALIIPCLNPGEMK